MWPKEEDIKKKILKNKVKCLPLSHRSLCGNQISGAAVNLRAHVSLRFSRGSLLPVLPSGADLLKLSHLKTISSPKADWAASRVVKRVLCGFHLLYVCVCVAWCCPAGEHNITPSDHHTRCFRCLGGLSPLVGRMRGSRHGVVVVAPDMPAEGHRESFWTQQVWAGVVL